MTKFALNASNLFWGLDKQNCVSTSFASFHSNLFRFEMLSSELDWFITYKKEEFNTYLGYRVLIVSWTRNTYQIQVDFWRLFTVKWIWCYDKKVAFEIQNWPFIQIVHSSWLNIKVLLNAVCLLFSSPYHLESFSHSEILVLLLHLSIDSRKSTQNRKLSFYHSFYGEIILWKTLFEIIFGKASLKFEWIY